MDECPYAATIQCLGICELSGNPLACKELNDEHFNEPLPQPEGAYDVETPTEHEENVEQQLPLSSELPPSTSRGNDRFHFETDRKIMAELAEGIVPQCTASSTRWALSNFRQWKKERNARYSYG
jgi:hypothetical protein